MSSNFKLGTIYHMFNLLIHEKKVLNYLWQNSLSYDVAKKMAIEARYYLSDVGKLAKVIWIEFLPTNIHNMTTIFKFPLQYLSPRQLT